MAIFKFDDNDIFINTLELYPEYSFFITSGSVFIDNRPNISGSAHGPPTTTSQQHTQNAAGNIFHTLHPEYGNTGWISLYEYNINRPSGSVITETDFNVPRNQDLQFGIKSTRVSETDPTGSMIRPFVIKDGLRNNLKVNSKSSFNALFDFGELIEGDYNLSSSIFRHYYPAVSPDNKFRPSRMTVGVNELALSDEITYNVSYSLKNVIERYRYKSPHMVFSSSAPMPIRNFYVDETNLLVIPSVFYGKKIKKGTVELNFYVTGSLVGTLKDTRQNGELVQTFITSSSPLDYSGSVAGIVLYNEGLILLTGSYQMGANNSITYPGGGGTVNKWMNFGAGLHSDPTTFDPSHQINLAGFEIKYQGISEKPTLMMMCHADYGQLNWSNNPTFLDTTASVNDYLLTETSFTQQEVTINNSADTELNQYEPSFKREVYINKVAIYDDNRNLIGIASLANPVRKIEDRQYTFKLKIDL